MPVHHFSNLRSDLTSEAVVAPEAVIKGPSHMSNQYAHKVKYPDSGSALALQFGAQEYLIWGARFGEC